MNGRVQTSQSAAAKNAVWVARLRHLSLALGVLTLFVFFATIPGRPLDSLRLLKAPRVVTSSLGVSISAAALDCKPPGTCADAPLSGATVRVFGEREDRYAFLTELTSNARGEVEFSNLAPGLYWLLAEADGYARASATLLLETRPRQIRMRLVPAARLRVTVLDDQRAPVERATVLVRGADPLPYGGLTDAQGNLAFERLPPPPWVVSVHARGFESFERQEVDQDLEVVLRRLSEVDVRVLGVDGQPAAGAEVSITGTLLFPPHRVTCNDAGEAKIHGLMSGSYDLQAKLGGAISVPRIGYLVERGQTQSITLYLQPGRRVEVLVTDGELDNADVVAGAEVVLVESGLSPFPVMGRTGPDGRVVLGPVPPGPASVAARADGFVGRSAVAVPEPVEGPLRVALLRGARLKGEVVDEDGYAVDGASVEIIGTDIDGLPIAETPLTIAFRSRHFDWSLEQSQRAIPSGELGVVPGPIPGVAAALGLTSSGFQFPEQERFPGDAWLREGSGLSEWVTDVRGEFSLFPVTPGRVRALVRHPDFVEALSDVRQLGPGGEAEVKVVMHRGGALAGHLVDDVGLPVAGARISVQATHGTHERVTYSASDGSFAFSTLPDSVVLTLSRPEDPLNVVLRRELNLAELGDEELELVMPAQRGIVRVVVQDQDDEPVASAQVTLLSLDPDVPLRKSLFTDEEGAVTFEDAAGLNATIRASAYGLAKSETTRKHLPEELTLRLARGVLVEGHVTAIRGREDLADARVTLISDGQRFATTTDQEGRYTLRDIPVGRASLSVEHSDFASASRRVEINDTGRADRALELDTIDLDEPGSVEGVVVDFEGNPVAGARVAVDLVPVFFSLGQLPAGVVASDTEGHFVLERVAPGVITLEAYASGVGRGQAGGVNIDSGHRTTDIQIELQPQEESVDPIADGGIAVTLGEHDEEDGAISVVVVHVGAASEAERGGLQVGDLVKKVDGKSVANMAEARSRMTGRVGSDVVLSVTRSGQTLSLRIRREQVRR